jgi:hypothetical protein
MVAHDPPAKDAIKLPQFEGELIWIRGDQRLAYYVSLIDR